MSEEDRLSVFEVLALNSIREGKSNDVDKEMLKTLFDRGLIEKRGKTRGTYYILSKSYYEFCDNAGEYSKMDDWNASQALPIIMAHFNTFKTAKMKDFVSVLGTHMSRKQIRNMINMFVERRILSKEGVGSGTTYYVSDEYIKNSELLTKAMAIGMEELKKRGEIE